MFFKKSLPKLIKQFKPSIAMVGFYIIRQNQNQTTMGIRGTAFCVAPFLLVTAAHVYQQMQEEEKNNIKVWVLDPADHLNYTMFNAQFISQDQQNDIALIKILNPFDKNKAGKEIILKSLLLSDSDNAMEGEEVFFCGFPESTMSLSPERQEISFVSAHAIVSSVKQDTNTKKVSVFFLDTNCDKGFSGSPVFLRNGKIVAVVSGRFESRDSRVPTGLGLARPINPLRTLLENYSKTI
ncbi:MAG: serine protease [Nanoarchaeota archaeon]|nr:serine protease [Nanoarchaeota archaeon]